MQSVLAHLELGRAAPLSVQVVGSNGKGSTTAILSSLFAEQGLRTAGFFSPHFVSVRERCLLNGKPASSQAMLLAANTVAKAEEQLGLSLTYFETMTAVFAVLCRDEGVEACVIEAGLGGRLDATSCLARDMVLFTPIALEHADILGPTLTHIATDKAACLPAQGLAVSARQTDEVWQALASVAAEKQAELHLADDLAVYDRGCNAVHLFGAAGELRAQDARLGLLGSHQAQNAALALAGLGLLAAKKGYTLKPEGVASGLAKAFVPGRLQLVRGPVMTENGDRLLAQGETLIADGAHNPHALEMLVRALAELGVRPHALVMTVLADKDLESMAAIARTFDPAPIFVPPMPDISRAADPHMLAAKLSGMACDSFAQALQAARAQARIRAGQAHPVVLVTGSLYLLGELFRLAPGLLSRPRS